MNVEPFAVALFVLLGTGFMTWAAFMSRSHIQSQATQAEITSTLRDTVMTLRDLDAKIDGHAERLARVEAKLEG